MANAKTVYFVRHGECEANLQGVIAGAGDDSPLTELGKQQAQVMAQKLKDIRFDLIITSPLSRAKDTARIIANELGIDPKLIIVSVEFTEKDVGEWSGKLKDDYFAFERSGKEAGETAATMQERVQRGITWLQKQSFQKALVVTHNGTVRMIRTVLENLPAKEFINIPQLLNAESYIAELYS